MTIATYQPHSVSVRNIPRIDLALAPWMLSLQERLNNETDLRFRHARRCAAALLGVPAGAGYVAVVGRRLTGKIYTRHRSRAADERGCTPGGRSFVNPKTRVIPSMTCCDLTRGCDSVRFLPHPTGSAGP